MNVLTAVLKRIALVLLVAFTPGAAAQEHENLKSYTDRGVMMYSDTARGFSKAKDPAVVWFKGRYFLYYTVKQNKEITGLRIGVATSDDMITWEKKGELKPTAEYEDKGFGAPGAIVLDGKVHLFYQSSGRGPKDAICHAWSDDGFTFTRNESNPVFRPTGDWCAGRAIDADVIEHNGKLLLYYATRDPQMKVQMIGAASARIDSGFGREDWTQLNPDGPILKPELPWEKNCIEASALCKHNGKLYMFYAGAYNNEPQQIGCAVSSDGVKWTRLFDGPFLASGKPGSWNESESGHPYAFTDRDNTTYLFYQGNNNKGRSYYLSKVRIGWEDGKPVIAAGLAD